MQRFIPITFKYFLPLVIFFLLETVTHGNEYLPLVFIAGYLTYIYKTSKHIKSEKFLFIIGLILGLSIELGMTQISRTQVWENTVFAIPMWLPFAWAVGAITFYRFGKEFEKK